MKKILYLFVLVSLVLFASCSKSNEDKIAAAFEDYASNNFDDPSTLEIVSIDIKDTIDFKKILDEMDQMRDSTSKAMNAKTDELLSLCNKYGRKLNYVPGFREQWADYMNLLEDNQTSRLSDLTLILSESDSKVDSLTQEDRLIESTVKYRVKESGELKLKSLNVYSDLGLKAILYAEEHEVPEKYMFIQKKVTICSSMIEDNVKIIDAASSLIDLINDNMK